MRRPDRAGGQDYLVGVRRLGPSVGLEFHAHGGRSVEDDSTGEGVRPDRQVGTVARLAQIRHRRADANAAGVVQRRGAYACGAGLVVVGAVREPAGAAGLVEGPLVRVQLVVLEAAHWDGAVASVEVAREVGVRLDTAEVRQQLLEAPLVVAHRGPGIVVVGYAAQEDLGVDRRRAAGDLAARHQHGRLVRAALRHEVPKVGGRPGAALVPVRAVAVLDVGRDRVVVRVVVARLD